MNNRGISLAGVIVGIGLIGILTTVMASVFTAQHRESKALQEKLASLDFEKLLIQSLADGQVCNYVLNNPSQITFDSTTTLPHKLTPSSPLYSHMKDPNTPGVVVAQVGEQASALSQTLKIKSIDLELISKSGNSYLGRWVIEFDNTNTVRHLKPATVSTTVTADLIDPNNATISTCQSESSASESYGYAEVDWVQFNCSSPDETTILTYEIEATGEPFVLFYELNVKGQDQPNYPATLSVSVYENNTQIYHVSGSPPGPSFTIIKQKLRTQLEGQVTYKVKVDGSGTYLSNCFASAKLYAIKI